jgi:hypothetical protein
MILNTHTHTHTHTLPPHTLRHTKIVISLIENCYKYANPSAGPRCMMSFSYWIGSTYDYLTYDKYCKLLEWSRSNCDHNWLNHDAHSKLYLPPALLIWPGWTKTRMVKTWGGLHKSWAHGVKRRPQSCAENAVS